MRHKWRRLSSSSAICIRCNVKKTQRTIGTKYSYDTKLYFIYPDGKEVPIERGDKIPPCDGRLVK
jgi:hypothetical protein